MENNENLVTEEVTENVEQTTEETPKTYTEAEFNAKLDEVIGKKLARREAKIRKEFERKYGDLEGVLNAGMGTKSVEEATDKLTKFYESKGVKIEKKPTPTYSAKEIETLARADAEEIIGYGFDEVVEEADRLNELGADKMTAKEKAVFKILTDYVQSTEQSRELAKIGVPKEVYESKEFNEYRGLFKSNVPITKVYEEYAKTQPKKEYKTTGSMKTTPSNDNGVKEYYTPEEARKFTKKELDDNPAIFQAIIKSMPKWKK